jgi:hypothetical protein
MTYPPSARFPACPSAPKSACTSPPTFKSSFSSTSEIIPILAAPCGHSLVLGSNIACNGATATWMGRPLIISDTWLGPDALGIQVPFEDAQLAGQKASIVVTTSQGTAATDVPLALFNIVPDLGACPN